MRIDDLFAPADGALGQRYPCLCAMVPVTKTAPLTAAFAKPSDALASEIIHPRHPQRQIDSGPDGLTQIQTGHQLANLAAG